MDDPDVLGFMKRRTVPTRLEMKWGEMSQIADVTATTRGSPAAGLNSGRYRNTVSTPTICEGTATWESVVNTASPVVRSMN